MHKKPKKLFLKAYNHDVGLKMNNQLIKKNLLIKKKTFLTLLVLFLT